MNLRIVFSFSTLFGKSPGNLAYWYHVSVSLSTRYHACICVVSITIVELTWPNRLPDQFWIWPGGAACPCRTSVGSCIIFSSSNYEYFFIIINDFECCWRALRESVVKRNAIAAQQFLCTSQTQYDFCALVDECLSSSLICITYSSCSVHIQLQQSNHVWEAKD